MNSETSPSDASLAESGAVSPLVYVVEDESDIARLICFHLQSNGFTARWFSSSIQVVEQATHERPAVFLLDIMIPGGRDGLSLCREIRITPALAGSQVIFLTAKTGEGDRVRGLEVGGDDYITKPFSPRELVARVRAVLRRSRELPMLKALHVGTLEIDRASMILKVSDKIVATTVREFRLLDYLATHNSVVFTRDQLLDAVWTEGSFVTPRSVDVYIRRLREKIEPAADNPTYIKTVRGIGYRFDTPK
jgi:DNA-binding response OmpR family regulator